MKYLVFFLEGPSEKEMLTGILPKIVPKHYNVQYIVFKGKQDMEES